MGIGLEPCSGRGDRWLRSDFGVGAMSVPSWAKPGVKCVCVNNDGWYRDGTPFESDVRLNGVYTIVEVITDSRGHVGISLWGQPLGEYYNVTQFRPLITKSQEQDVALFRHHLDGLPVGADV